MSFTVGPDVAFVDNVRDFYLAEVLRLDPTELRRTDPVRYLRDRVPISRPGATI